MFVMYNVCNVICLLGYQLYIILFNKTTTNNRITLFQFVHFNFHVIQVTRLERSDFVTLELFQLDFITQELNHSGGVIPTVV